MDTKQLDPSNGAPAQVLGDPGISRRALLILGAGALVAPVAVCRGEETIPTITNRNTAEIAPPSPAMSSGYFIDGTRYTHLAEALAALQDGQTLDIAPGNHSGEAGYCRASNITIRASAEAVFDSVYGGKSTFVLAGDNVTLLNLAGVEITNGSGNGGLIRFEGRHLTATGIRLDRCQTGILTGNARPDSIVKLNDIKGRENGTPGDGQSHAIYIGACAELHVTNADLADTSIGHLIKSRAAKNVITGCRLVEGAASRALDICNGGELEIGNTYFKQTQATDNPDVIGYGAECAKNAAGVRVPTYTVNTVNIAADVHCFDERNPRGRFFNAFIIPTVFNNLGTYNVGVDPYPTARRVVIPG